MCTKWDMFVYVSYVYTTNLSISLFITMRILWGIKYFLESYDFLGPDLMWDEKKMEISEILPIFWPVNWMYMFYSLGI